MNVIAHRRIARARLPALDPRLRSRSLADYRDARLHVAALSVVAGSVHAVVAAPHFGEFWLFGSFFVGLALFQLAWGVQAYRRPSPTLYRVGLWVSVAIVVLWLASRTIGLPLGPEPGAVEPVGPLDPVASAIELAIAGLCYAHLRPRARLPAPVGAIRASALALMWGGLLLLVLGAGHHY